MLVFKRCQYLRQKKWSSSSRLLESTCREASPAPWIFWHKNLQQKQTKNWTEWEPLNQWTRESYLSTPFPSRKKTCLLHFFIYESGGGWKMMKIPNRKLLRIKSCLRTQGLAMTTSPPPSPTRDGVGCGGNEKAITRIHLSYLILDGWASGRWWEGVVRRLGKAFLNNAHS